MTKRILVKEAKNKPAKGKIIIRKKAAPAKTQKQKMKEYQQTRKRYA